MFASEAKPDSERRMGSYAKNCHRVSQKEEMYEIRLLP